MGCGIVMVEEALIVELKSLEGVKRIHEAQLLTYLKGPEPRRASRSTSTSRS